MEYILEIFQNPMYLNLFTAMALGMLLGVERFLAGKTAGMRTYTLVSLGSALFISISQSVASDLTGASLFDPLRMAAQVIAAAGFLGVGAIFHRDNHISGVTTATGLWVSAGVGMAAGFGLHALALMATILTLVTFIVLWFVEKQLRGFSVKNDEGGNHPVL